MKFIALNNSPFAGGGVERVVAKLLDNFSAEFKQEVCLLCNDPSRPDEFEYRGIKCVNLKVARRGIVDKLFFWGRYVYSYRIYRFLRERSADEVLTANIHGIEYALFPSLFRHRIQARLYLTVSVHGSNFDEMTQYFVRRLPWKFWFLKAFCAVFRWVHFLAEKWTCAGVDAFTFINQYTRTFYLKNYRIDDAKCCVTYNGLDGGETPGRQTKTDQRFQALIVGSTVYRKGLDHAIAIVEKLQSAGYDLRLTVVGFGDFERYRGHKKWPFVNYIGRVAPEEMARYYREADFLLFPSRFEGFPLTILESLQHKMPVVVSQACAFDEIPRHTDYGIIVSDYDPASWVKVLRENILDLNRYNALLANLNKLDLAAFRWPVIAREYEKVLSSQV